MTEPRTAGLLREAIRERVEEIVLLWGLGDSPLRDDTDRFVSEIADAARAALADTGDSGGPLDEAEFRDGWSTGRWRREGWHHMECWRLFTIDPAQGCICARISSKEADREGVPEGEA